jgi:gluconate 5-dehydrogenase
VPTSLFDLSGRIALVTGAAQGLGHAIARGLGEAGAVVVLNDVDRERLDAAVALLRADGIATHAVAFDVTDRAAIDAAVEEVEAGIGPIRILVNNAGINHRAPLEDVTEDAWDRLMDINVKGVFLVSQSVARRMLPRGRGKIINISSVNAVQGRASIGPYTAAKGAVTNLTKAMATEWAGRGIQVNAIGPGYFLTRMAAPLVDDPVFIEWLLRRVPVGRWGDPQELAGTAVYLASDASSFVNGQTIYVDGGLLARL